MCNESIKVHEAFDTHFANIVPKLRDKMKTTNSYTDYVQNQLPNSLVTEDITCADIINIIRNIKSKSNTEFDMISSQLLKNSMEHIASSMAEICNAMIRSNIFPYDLNVVNMITNLELPVCLQTTCPSHLILILMSEYAMYSDNYIFVVR